MEGSKALLRLRIVPNARKSEVVGPYGEAIKIKIQAPALEGKANEAVRKFLAERLQVPPARVELVSGEKSRDKLVSIMGLSSDEARARLLAT